MNSVNRRDTEFHLEEEEEEEEERKGCEVSDLLGVNLRELEVGVTRVEGYRLVKGM